MTYFVLNYVDDFVGADMKSRIYQSHLVFLWLLRDIGTQRSEKKSVPPVQIVEFIGTLFNAIYFTMGITPVRKIEIMQELSKWKFKWVTTRRELESLVGKLQFISNCVRPGCLFVSRLLEELKEMKRGGSYILNNQARKDIQWWYEFKTQYEGTSIKWLLEVEQVDSEFAVDASLIAAGGVSGNDFFRITFPDHLKNKCKITHYELWAVLIAVKLWSHKFTGKLIKVHSDNEAVATIINSGRSKDLYLQAQLRELMWWAAKGQFRLKSVHLSGQLNRLPDILSRWYEGPHMQKEFNERMKGRRMQMNKVGKETFRFSSLW